MLKIGIVGLPNVGKSTLFNALLKKQVAHVANYPFATIDPNVGVVAVPDSRLDSLATVIASEAKQSLSRVIPGQDPESMQNGSRIKSGMTMRRPPIVPAAVEFYDIAGLVAGASKGEGLGNKFLSHIKEVDAIVHVVRLFEDGDILRTGENPESDLAVVETELILKDLGTLSRQSRPNKKMEKQEILFYDTVELLQKKLDEGTPARAISLSDIQIEAIKPLNLLTIKPVLYVFNLSEKQLLQKETIGNQIDVILGSKATPESRSWTSQDDAKRSVSSFMFHDSWLFLCAKLESDIVSLTHEDQAEYLKEYGLEEPGLNRLIKVGYEMLGLISFLTAGVKEVRAWTIPKGTLAPQAAGTIHTDFIKHFIKAEVVPFDTFVALGGWQSCRDAGKVTLGGRDYIMRDGDVVDFKVNA